MTPEEQAHAQALATLEAPTELGRRLSWWRLGGVALLAGAVAVGIVGFRSGDRPPAGPATASSFQPYVDVTATPEFGFEDPSQSAATNVVLGFVVSSPSNACQPSWGASYSLDAAASTLDLDRRVARLRQRGGLVTVSFGGQRNSELALTCTDPAQLAAAYQAVVDRYHPSAVDVDVEGAAASAPDVAARRAAALAAVQRAETAAGRSLPVWLTLPVSPQGLTGDGLTGLDSMLAAKVDLAGVNAMTMDYGTAVPAGQTMADLAESSLTGVQKQLVASYAKAGLSLRNEGAWQRLGATPMIGQNDTVGERFGLADAERLLAFARSHQMQRLSMWSLNRDKSCGPNYANVEVVSPSCSGIDQQTGAFTAVFEPFTSGPPDASATPSPAPTGPDDPATSPYAIWNPSTAYPKGTKIVWHHNVYEAKWYTQGDVPDAPVSSASATPWTLIGPVLPGESPAPLPTVSAGTYPAWNAAQVYVGGDRVVYNGVGYQAKWWTQGDAPVPPGSAAAANAPWQVLTS